MRCSAIEMFNFTDKYTLTESLVLLLICPSVILRKTRNNQSINPFLSAYEIFSSTHTWITPRLQPQTVPSWRRWKSPTLPPLSTTHLLLKWKLQLHLKVRKLVIWSDFLCVRSVLTVYACNVKIYVFFNELGYFFKA